MVKWFVYILKCIDGSLYTGATNDLNRRFEEHKKGKGGRYTRSHNPEKIIFSEKLDSKILALKRERQIKGWSHNKKLEFIQSQNPPG